MPVYGRVFIKFDLIYLVCNGGNARVQVRLLKGVSRKQKIAKSKEGLGRKENKENSERSRGADIC